MTDQNESQELPDVLDAMEVIRSKYIEGERDALVRGKLDMLLRYRAQNVRTFQTAPKMGMVVTGASGEGKTHLLNRLFLNHPDLPGFKDEGADCPLVSLRMPTPVTLKSLGQTTIAAMGLPVKKTGSSASGAKVDTEATATDLWREVSKQARDTGIVALHFDEAQDLLATKSAKDTQEILSAFKSLMQYEGWPLIIILSGTPQIADYVKKDYQLFRRMFHVALEPVFPEHDAPGIAALFNQYAGVAGIKSAVGKPDENGGFEDPEGIVPRLIHSSGGQFGLTLTFICEGIQAALFSGSERLGIFEMSEGYAEYTGCIAALNIFDAPEYLLIDPKAGQETVSDEEETEKPRKRKR